MNTPDFLRLFEEKASEYISLNGIEVVDKNGKPISKITFRINEGKIVIE